VESYRRLLNLNFSVQKKKKKEKKTTARDEERTKVLSKEGKTERGVCGYSNVVADPFNHPRKDMEEDIQNYGTMTDSENRKDIDCHKAANFVQKVDMSAPVQLYRLPLSTTLSVRRGKDKENKSKNSEYQYRR
jgi:hypothetical protein